MTGRTAREHRKTPRAAHRPGSADQQLARLPGADVQPCRAVDHPGLGAGQQRADRLGQAATAVGHHVGGAAELGHSVGLLDPAAQPLGALGGLGGTERSRARCDQAQAGQVVPGHGGVPGQTQHDRRDHLHPGHAVLLNQPAEVLQVEPGHGDHRGPCGQARLSVICRAKMWYSGSTVATTSSGPTRCTARVWHRLATRLRCESSTPFGSPVVPLE